MTLPQWGMLRAVAGNPDASTHSLGLITGQSDQAAGAVVARLQHRDLLDRRSGAGKAIRHQITAAGAELLGNCDQAVTRAMRATLADFTDHELKTLREFLDRLAGLT